MSGLSHGVVRVDAENSLTSLTLQDCGQVLPGASLVVVKVDGTLPVICKTDEVGEICMKSGATGSSYWGLPGLSNASFRVLPTEGGEGAAESSEAETTSIGGTPLGDYVRTGLLGFLGPGGLVFVCGSRDGLMTVTGRKHLAVFVVKLGCWAVARTAAC